LRILAKQIASFPGFGLLWRPTGKMPAIKVLLYSASTVCARESFLAIYPVIGSSARNDVIMKSLKMLVTVMTNSAVRRMKNGLFGSWRSPLFFLIIFYLLNSETIVAQQNFTPLQPGEYEVKEESGFFNPGIKVEGSYDAYYSAFKKDFVNGESISDGFLQDVEIRIRSMVNTNLSVHAYIGNKSKVVSTQDDPFVTAYPDEASDSSTDSGGMDLEFREAFLEYNHNPNARLLIGKQFINVGDRIGLIYQGRANAVTQQCRIGTWCYYIGGARLGNNGDSGLFWFQLDYPIYESGVLVADPWFEKETRQQSSFNVELLRVIYRGTNIPMSRAGIWTGEGSVYQDTIVDGTTTKYVYFENDGVEYIGFNFRWNYFDSILRFSWINLAGKRDYFSRAKGADREFLSTKEISGNAYFLDFDYRFHSNWKAALTLFTSTGDELNNDGEEIWERNSTTYREVQSGDFGDALIYFNGKEGLGQGHSVSNLTFYSLRWKYISDKKNVAVLFAAYSFKRSQPVFFNKEGAEEETSTEIGNELDFTVTWRLEEKLQAGLQLAMFMPNNAYSASDNNRPTEDPEDFSQIGLTVSYTF
jgi:hypothetical protein